MFCKLQYVYVILCCEKYSPLVLLCAMFYFFLISETCRINNEYFTEFVKKSIMLDLQAKESAVKNKSSKNSDKFHSIFCVFRATTSQKLNCPGNSIKPENLNDVFRSNSILFCCRLLTIPKISALFGYLKII